MKVYDGYGNDIKGMIGDIIDRREPGYVHVDIFPGPDPQGHKGTFVVATWRIGNELYMAWEPVPAGRAERLKVLQRWVGFAQLRSPEVRGGLAHPDCWPPQSGWLTGRRQPTVSVAA
jgi:hypothetical protein